LIGAFNLTAGYSAGFALGFMALRRRPMPYLAWDMAWLPVYWLMMSLAAYRALWQLATRPFYWEKTGHGIDLTRAPLPRLDLPDGGTAHDRHDRQGS
jgi:glycosyltransferase XagB